ICTTGRDDSAGSGTGGAKTGSLSGGISARSEKLLPDEPATGSDIIGSTATRGECRSVSCSTTAADKTGPCAAWDSGALTSKSPMSRAPEFESDFEPKFASELVLDALALPRVTAAAAAAAALVPAAGGSACENTGASI